MSGILVSAGNVTRQLSDFRRWLRRHPAVAQAVRAVRAALCFGPWRLVFRQVLRVTRPPRASSGEASTSLLPGVSTLSTWAIVQAVRECSASPPLALPLAFVAALRATTDALPAGDYAKFDEHSPEVCALVTDPGVLGVLRAYFGAEPVMLECTVVVHEKGRGEVPPSSDQRKFHFDYAGWQSLNLFVYLTDVDACTSAHEVAMGSHRKRTFMDLLRPFVPDEEVFTRFGPRIRTIVGPAGTAFFENTEAFHRHRRTGRRRVMLNVLFASHRGVLSRGRNARSYGQYLRKHGKRADGAAGGEVPALR